MFVGGGESIPGGARGLPGWRPSMARRPSSAGACLRLSGQAPPARNAAAEPGGGAGRRRIKHNRMMTGERPVERAVGESGREVVSVECEICHAEIEAGEERQLAGKTVCEDCFIDASMETKACDPWAVRSAKSTERMMGEATVNPLQARILEILEESGGMEKPELMAKLGEGITERELQTQFALLRHMEKVRAEKRGDRVFMRLW